MIYLVPGLGLELGTLNTGMLCHLTSDISSTVPGLGLELGTLNTWMLCHLTSDISSTGMKITIPQWSELCQTTM